MKAQFLSLLARCGLSHLVCAVVGHDDVLLPPSSGSLCECRRCGHVERLPMFLRKQAE